MNESAGSSAEHNRAPVFLVLSDLWPHDAVWPRAQSQMEDVRRECARALAFDPDVRMEPIDGWVAEPGRETFLIPAALDFSLWERESLGQRIAALRRKTPDLAVLHDDVDPCHPLPAGALAEQAARALGETPPQHAGLILAASGYGDSGSRAHSYRLMRMLWEQLGFARAEVAFVRHAQPFLAHVLERCAIEPLPWVVLFQGQWETEHAAYARVILENFQRCHPEAVSWRFADVPGAHPMLTAWFAQRITQLWREKRSRDAVRMPSAKRSAARKSVIAACGAGFIARTPDRDALAETLDRILPNRKSERVLVKVTWHGYATGTYTDPAALDLLLRALRAPAIVLEGHTSSRNLGGARFNWETEARANRAWIRQQEAEYLRRTGLCDVIARHRAQYVSVTEAFWDEQRDVDPAEFIPETLLEFQGCPLISFAKFKGPTRLGISNMFGLIPLPLRSAWHGPNITWFARACCGIAKRYASEFQLYGLVEGLYSAVRWNRQGLYRSRWGNYDLIRDAGWITASRGLIPADILAARVQGQDVSQSAFFDVVREELGWDAEAAEASLPPEIEGIF